MAARLIDDLSDSLDSSDCSDPDTADDRYKKLCFQVRRGICDNNACIHPLVTHQNDLTCALNVFCLGGTFLVTYRSVLLILDVIISLALFIARLS